MAGSIEEINNGDSEFSPVDVVKGSTVSSAAIVKRTVYL